MRPFFSLLVVCVVSLFLISCRTTPTKVQSQSVESNQQVLTAVGQVADALTGQELTPAQKQKLTQDLKKDKQAQSALRSIAGAMDVKQARIKYCPLDGKRYNFDLEVCPIHNVKLEELVD